MSNEKKLQNGPDHSPDVQMEKVKFEVYGEEMVEKIVRLSGNSGRVYLPPDWVGSRVKIIRL
jgi:putative transposon-encoded protein